MTKTMWKCKNIFFVLLTLHMCLTVRVDAELNICTTLCRCVNESHFVKVHCDFIGNKEYTLDNSLRLPSLSNAINITLGDKSTLLIKNGFFSSNNRINSLAIQGLQENFKMTQSYVELWRNSLHGIWGNFPEISFRNLKNVLMSEKSLDGLLEINLIVENVWQLTMDKEVFGTTSFNASFSDVADLILNKGVLATSSFNLTKPKIFINRSWIRNLHPMGGRKLTELRIENSDIETIRSSAFNILELPSLVLDNVKIQSIESDIFSVGILLQNLAVINCKIDKIASKAIREAGISKFTFEKNIINLIEESSMEFAGSSILIAHNKINLLGANWLKSHQWHQVNVLNNSLGSFHSMSLENPTTDVEDFQCNFHHISFTEVQPGGFRSISNKCKFTELLFKQQCACNFHNWLEKLFDKSMSLKKIQSESFCSLDSNDTLFRCLRAETVNYDQYHDEICSRKKSKLKCNRLKVDKIDVRFIDSKVISNDFDWTDYTHYLITGVICVLLVLCCCVTIIVRKKSRNTASDHCSTTMQPRTDLSQLNQSEGPPSYEASLHPIKSFSNRDHIIIRKTLETMKQKQPEEKYEIVFNNTKRLLHEQLNEYEKVKIIGDIVQTIGECENCGEDFVAFTDILYKHLAPDSNNTTRTTAIHRPQPPNYGFYAEPSSSQTQNASKNNSEHIYAEPTVLTQQQTMTPLLLANNYSNPVDNNVINNNSSNLYSEPVIRELIETSLFKTNLAVPYAVSSAIDEKSKNLPDIVHRMEPGTSNELNRITRSPTTNRKIPEYTVPSTSHKIPLKITQQTIEDWSDESLENSTSSQHSGGSNATVRVDELIEYADNEPKSLFNSKTSAHETTSK